MIYFIFTAALLFNMSNSHGSNQLIKPICSTIAPPGGLAVHECLKPTLEQQKVIENVNAQLYILGADILWSERKRIIKKAVEQGIHPDHLVSDSATALAQAARELENDDIDFARFLLEHDADPNQRDSDYLESPIFMRIKTPAMAQLFYYHGAKGTVQNRREQILNGSIFCHRSLLLTRWCISRHVDPHQEWQRLPALNHIAFSCAYSWHPEAAQVLMNAGAALDTQIESPNHSMRGFTVPQMVNAQLTGLEQLQNPTKFEAESLTQLNNLRTFLLKSSWQRSARIFKTTNLIPPISALVSRYAEAPYLDLENAPCSATNTQSKNDGSNQKEKE